MIKVGDKVRLKREIKSGMSGFAGGVNSLMVSLTQRHKEFTVTDVDFSREEYFKIEEDNGVWYWDKTFFEVVEKACDTKVLEVGDKIKIISASNGAYGANGRIGVVTNKKSTDGLHDWNNGFNVEVEDKSIWRIGFDSKVKLIGKEKKRKEVKDIKIIFDGNETIAIVDDAVGRARKNKEDFQDDNIGMIVSLMRAFKMDKEDIDNVIDVLFDGMPETRELKDYSNKELIEEIQRRM